MKASAAFIVMCCTNSLGQVVLKQQSIFKGQVKWGSRRWSQGGLVCGQLEHSSPTGWRWGNTAVSQGLTLSVLRHSMSGATYSWSSNKFLPCGGGFSIYKVFIRYCYLGNFREELQQKLGGSVCLWKAPSGPAWSHNSESCSVMSDSL